METFNISDSLYKYAAKVSEEYSELRTELAAVRAERAHLERRLQGLASLLRMEGQDCTLPWRSNNSGS